ncbi:DUF4013 domain-containing protein [Methanoculleus sp. Wushi-C6]|uniref:DUF4013 domain-containing protein n=1 Tax=Methanoculleus caldifontis TaxID=2651577 RepID=A0ABU3WXC7_9EURY|nr:DUF4013 domain-containing protein [Methanoculleus sp. Wushi-C6]MDV2480438.1 DUF4013 domain-containing protein [Methanoculleus sp. Wushi-C6]
MSINYQRALEDSFDYTRDALRGGLVRWLQLIACIVVFPLIYGYFVRIMRGDAPDLGGWGRLFSDGLKLLVVYLAYIGLMLLAATALMGGAGILGGQGLVAAVAALAAFVFFLVIWLVMQMAAVRFAKTGSLRAAFDIPAVLAQIRTIGWGSYIFSQIILQLVLMIFTMVLVFLVVTVAGIVGLFAGIVGILLVPVLMLAVSLAIYIFQYRYNTLVYESGEATSGFPPVTA